MHEPATLIIAILGFAVVWTTSVVAMVSWLNGKFRALEVLIYKEDAKHRDMFDRRVSRHAVRIQRLESNAFGVTHSGEFEDGSYED